MVSLDRVAREKKEENMARRLLRAIVAAALSVSSGALLLQEGCGFGGYNDGCIGPDGYNWCIAGGGWGEIHTPSVQSWDFSE